MGVTVRRIPASVFVLLGAVLLLAPAPALAASGASLTPGAVPVSHVDSAQLGGATYDISGTVLDYSGNPVSGAAVGWGWMPPGYELDPLDAAQFGGGAPVAGGQFSFANVSSHPGNDFLWVEYEAADLPPQWLASWACDFSTNNQASSYRYSVQPGAIDIQITKPPVAFDPQVDVYGAAGMAQSFPSLFSGVGLVPVAPPSFNDVVVSDVQTPGDAQNVTAAAEWLSPSAVPVAAGSQASSSVVFDWSHAQRAYLAGPPCQHCGRPGSVVSVVLKGWPAGEKADFQLTDYKPYTTQVSSAGPGKTYVVKLRIPTSAQPGESYDLTTYRTDDPASHLSLWDGFQVCAFRATADVISPGAGIRLSGTMPSTWRYVWLFARRSRAARPATVTAKGWRKVGRYRANDNGKFVSALLHPSRTTWYVARYPRISDDGPSFYFTPVVKVSVR